MDLEDMSVSHMERVIAMIESGDIVLMGLEDDYVQMFREEIEDRDEELDFD